VAKTARQPGARSVGRVKRRQTCAVFPCASGGFPARGDTAHGKRKPLVYCPYFTAQKMTVKKTVKMTQLLPSKGAKSGGRDGIVGEGIQKAVCAAYPVGCFFRRTRRSYCPSRGRHVKGCLPEAGAVF